MKTTSLRRPRKTAGISENPGLFSERKPKAHPLVSARFTTSSPFGFRFGPLRPEIYPLADPCLHLLPY